MEEASTKDVKREVREDMRDRVLSEHDTVSVDDRA